MCGAQTSKRVCRVHASGPCPPRRSPCFQQGTRPARRPRARGNRAGRRRARGGACDRACPALREGKRPVVKLCSPHPRLFFFAFGVDFWHYGVDGSTQKKRENEKNRPDSENEKTTFFKKNPASIRRGFDEDSFKKARLHFSVWNGSYCVSCFSTATINTECLSFSVCR